MALVYMLTQQVADPVSFLYVQLEDRLEELLTELKESHDKLVHQDQAAKANLLQVQKETTYRLEQVQLEL